MPILTDKEQLLNSLPEGTIDHGWYREDVHLTVEEFEKIIIKAPTIIAIPIDWIYKYADTKDNDIKCLLLDMLEEYLQTEKEEIEEKRDDYMNDKIIC